MSTFLRAVSRGFGRLSSPAARWCTSAEGLQYPFAKKSQMILEKKEKNRSKKRKELMCEAFF
jgi:hypothetical protein